MNDLFHKVLHEIIPSDARHKIVNYWKRFGVEPEIRVGDCEPQIPNNVKWAAVGPVRPGRALHVFYFRSFLENAPEEIRITIIKHELIHVFFEADNTPEKVLNTKLLSTIMHRDSTDPLRVIQALELSNLDEAVVGQMNQFWGSDQSAAFKWIAEYEKQKA